MTPNSLLTIVLMRHGEEKDNKLTPKGVAQVYASTTDLLQFNHHFDELICACMNCTWQSAIVAKAGLLAELKPRLEKNLLPNDLYRDCFYGEPDALKKENQKIHKIGGMVSDALMVSKWADTGRKRLVDTLKEMAWRMHERRQNRCLAFGYSPFLELASINPESTPYCIGEGDAIIYKVEINAEEIKIVSSRFYKAPLPNLGKM